MCGGQMPPHPCSLQVLLPRSGAAHPRPPNGSRVLTAAQFVHDDERLARGVLEHLRGLGELDEERALPRHQIVRGTEPREDAVHHTELALLRGHEAAHLRHDHRDARLPKQRRLAAHVGPRQQQRAGAVAAQHLPSHARGGAGTATKSPNVAVLANVGRRPQSAWRRTTNWARGRGVQRARSGGERCGQCDVQRRWG